MASEIILTTEGNSDSQPDFGQFSAIIGELLHRDDGQVGYYEISFKDEEGKEIKGVISSTPDPSISYMEINNSYSVSSKFVGGNFSITVQEMDFENPYDIYIERRVVNGQILYLGFRSKIHEGQNDTAYFAVKGLDHLLDLPKSVDELRERLNDGTGIVSATNIKVIETAVLSANFDSN